MEATIDGKLPERPAIDPFVYRLLAGIAFGVALLNAGFAVNLTYQRIPNLQRVIDNVRLDSIGRGGEWLLEKHFLVTSAALTALGASLGVSIAAVRKCQRSAIVFVYVLNFIAIGTTLAAEFAMTRVWTRVLSKSLGQ